MQLAEVRNLFLPFTIFVGGFFAIAIDIKTLCIYGMQKAEFLFLWPHKTSSIHSVGKEILKFCHLADKQTTQKINLCK